MDVSESGEILSDDIWEAMIIQKFKQGDNEIRIESAESVEDAAKNGFNQGEYSRFFVNNKSVPSYMTLIQYMISETHRHKTPFIPNTKEIIEQRKDLLRRQNADMKKQILELKKMYGSSGLSEEMLKPLDMMIEKIDEYGVRVIE